MTNKKSEKNETAEIKPPFKTRRVDCPSTIFGEGAYFLRKRFIKTRQIQVLESVVQSGDLGKINKLLAEYVWQWNIVDAETGDPLPQPYQNPDAFGELDYGEQLSWVLQKGFFEPKNYS